MRELYYRLPILTACYLVGLLLATSLFFNPLKARDFSLMINFSPLVLITRGVFFLILLINIGTLIKSLRRSAQLGSLVLAFLLGIIVSVNQFISLLSPLPQFEGARVLVRGEIQSSPKELGDNVQYVFELKALKYEDSWQPIRGKTLLRASKDYLWAHGTLLEVHGVIKEPRRALNPGEFCYRRYLAREGIFTLFKAEGGPKVVRERVFPSIKGLTSDIQKALVDFHRKTLEPKGAEIINSMTLGYTQGLDRDLREEMNRLGLAHLLAVSGFHVALVAAFPLALASRLTWSPKRTFAITALVVVIYALITGGKAPVFRATLMILAPLAGKMINRESSWIHNLSIAVLVLTFIKPSVVLQGGFQLSLIATWGILALTKPIMKGLQIIPKSLAFGLAVPLAAQIATLPIIVYHFNELPILGVLANLLLVDLATLIIYFGMFAALISRISFALGEFVNLATDFWLGVFVWIIKACQGLPGLTYNVTSPSLWMILSFYILLTLWAWPRLRYLALLRIKGFMYSIPFRLKTSASILIVLSLALWLLIPGKQFLEVTFLAVGQGDSAVIITPQGKTVIIDTGPKIDDEKGYSFDAGKDIILPFLKYKGINEVDLIIITHPHSDHYGGIEGITKRIKVKQVAVLKGQAKDEPYLSMSKHLKTDHGGLLEVALGDQIVVDRETLIKVLHPKPWEGTLGEEDFNNNSLVVQLQHKDKSLLFTGDIEQEAIEIINKEYGSKLSSQILKFPHHGSKGSIDDEFYKNIDSNAVIISVGKNFYGHPHRETLEYLQNQGVRVYRTDNDGAIYLKIDSEIRLKPFI